MQQFSSFACVGSTTGHLFASIPRGGCTPQVKRRDFRLPIATSSRFERAFLVVMRRLKNRFELYRSLSKRFFRVLPQNLLTTTKAKASTRKRSAEAMRNSLERARNDWPTHRPESRKTFSSAPATIGSLTVNWLTQPLLARKEGRSGQLTHFCQLLQVC